MQSMPVIYIDIHYIYIHEYMRLYTNKSLYIYIYTMPIYKPEESADPN